jgi:hypothetical protein
VCGDHAVGPLPSESAFLGLEIERKGSRQRSSRTDDARGDGYYGAMNRGQFFVIFLIKFRAIRSEAAQLK